MKIENIELEYLYRDTANYKQYGSVIFSNPDRVSTEELEILLRKKLIDEEFFDHKIFQLPSLFFKDYDSVLDHSLHEFIRLSYTSNLPTDERNIVAFIQDIK